MTERAAAWGSLRVRRESLGSWGTVLQVGPRDELALWFFVPFVAARSTTLRDRLNDIELAPIGTQCVIRSTDYGSVNESQLLEIKK